jgi:RNA-directed DNA polymerase
MLAVLQMASRPHGCASRALRALHGPRHTPGGAPDCPSCEGALPGVTGIFPEDNLRRFRNRLRGMRDRWRAGTIDRKTVVQRVTSWIAHAEHADTWRLRRAIFRGGWFDPGLSQRRKPGPPPDAAGWFAGAPGTTNRRTCARPTATGTSPTTGTTTSASGWPVRPHAGADGPKDPPGVPRRVQGGP